MVAQEAARIIVNHGVRDYGAAKIKVDGSAPLVKYKYTIWDDAKKCPPLDPHFRVNN